MICVVSKLLADPFHVCSQAAAQRTSVHQKVTWQVDAHSARPESWQVHTSTSLSQLTMLSPGSRPQ